MNALVYFLALPFFYAIAWLPLWALNLLSDGLFFILYRVIGYRKKIVRQNLANAFPNKTAEERLEIERKFFSWLCDLMLETIKTLTISKKTILNRCRVINPELVTQYVLNNRSVILVMGHFGNWEWGGLAFSLAIPDKLNVIYKKLNNPYFDRLLYKMRSRFGTGLVEMKDVARQMIAEKHKKVATAFIADQTPQPDHAYWTIFLNQETPVFTGTERMARKLNQPVIYVQVRPTERSKYDLTFELLVENPAETNEGEISKIHTARLEQDIISLPQYWLWSHRRWKHKKN